MAKSLLNSSLTIPPFLRPSHNPKLTAPALPSKSSTSSNLYEARKPCSSFFSSSLIADSSNLKSSNSSAKVFCFLALSAQGLAACRLKAEEEGDWGRVRIVPRLRSDDAEGRRKLWETCAKRVMARRRTRKRAGCWWRYCSILELPIVGVCACS